MSTAAGGDAETRIAAITSAHSNSGSFSRNPFTPRDRPPSGLRTGGTVSGASKTTTAAAAAAAASSSASVSPESGTGMRGRSKGTPVPGGARLPAQENFLSSLHLDQEQMSDFHNSEGHFLYLRQKAGADATAYNLEVRTAASAIQYLHRTLSVSFCTCVPAEREVAIPKIGVVASGVLVFRSKSC